VHLLCTDGSKKTGLCLLLNPMSLFSPSHGPLSAAEWICFTTDNELRWGTWVAKFTRAGSVEVWSTFQTILHFSGLVPFVHGRIALIEQVLLLIWQLRVWRLDAVLLDWYAPSGQCLLSSRALFLPLKTVLVSILTTMIPDQTQTQVGYLHLQLGHLLGPD
jgi:hypothetical protein